MALKSARPNATASDRTRQEACLSETVPNFGALLAPVLTRVDRRHRPRFLALLERTAADRYRMWADALPQHCAELMGCAASGDDIADCIEGAFPIADADLDSLRHLVPEARSIALIAPRSTSILWVDERLVPIPKSTAMSPSGALGASRCE